MQTDQSKRDIIIGYVLIHHGPLPVILMVMLYFNNVSIVTFLYFGDVYK